MPLSTLCASQAVSEPGDEQIYLDHNATTPLAPELAPKLAEWALAWGNPSSIHWAGRKPKMLIRDARRAIARLLNIEPLEVVFTSGGSEANNFALKGVFERERLVAANGGGPRRDHYVFSDVEHPSVRRTAEYLASCGALVDFVPVDRDGRLDLERLQSLVTERTALVSIMLANNETGTIFPIAEIAALARSKGALVHTDAVQALGKIPVDLKSLGVDLATFSGHKFYAMNGVGVLYVRRGLQLESLIHGGGQERHRRGGTENVLAICTLGAMAERGAEIASRAEALRVLRDEFEARIKSELSGVRITAGASSRLPNTSSLVIDGVDGETLLMNLDIRGFAVSTGAACSSGSPEPSPVLLAMGLTREEAQSSLRIGLGWGTSPEQVFRFIDTLKEIVLHLRSFRPAMTGLEVNDVQ